VGPANLPDNVVHKLNDAFNKIAGTPDFSKKLDTLYFGPVTGTPGEFKQLVSSDLAKWKEIGKTVKISTY
jgi:tripartite-type tricarboxylate transporter receptor subunit TctC